MAASKTVYLVRHAQATHNKTMTDGLADGMDSDDAFMLMAVPQLLDARLTPLGLGQAKALNAFLKAKTAELGTDGIELVASSPLSRTLATASTVFDGVGAGSFQALPDLRERMSTVSTAHVHCVAPPPPLLSPRIARPTALDLCAPPALPCAAAMRHQRERPCIPVRKAPHRLGATGGLPVVRLCRAAGGG